MSSNSDIPRRSEEEPLDGDHFTVTIARDGTTNYEFRDHATVERFFGARVVTTPSALREIVREISASAKSRKRWATADSSERSNGEAPPAVASHTQAGGPIHDDTIVDQRSGLVPKDLYLRLARQSAFPSRKIGKRIVARWGDVRAAFTRGPSVRQARPSSTPPEPKHDRLDGLRQQLGLAPKGK
jgi:hypothetical protein